MSEREYYKEIAGILANEVEELKQLLDVVEQEKQLVLEGRPEQLVPVSERKLAICHRLQQLKAQRLELMAAAGIDPGGPRALEQLVTAAPLPHRERLTRLVDKARALARSVARVGEANKAYLKEALDTIEKLLGILTGADQPQAYGRRPAQALGPRLVAKEV